MRKVLPVALLLVTGVVLGALAFMGYITRFGFRTSLTENGSGVVRYPQPSQFKGDVLRSLPEPGAFGVVNLRGDDLRAVDLRSLRREMHLTFDSNTSWPTNVPTWFSPQHVLEWGKNAGLGLRSLHG